MSKLASQKVSDSSQSRVAIKEDVADLLEGLEQMKATDITSEPHDLGSGDRKEVVEGNAEKPRASILPPQIKSYDEVKAEWDRLDEDARADCPEAGNGVEAPLNISFEDLLSEGNEQGDSKPKVEVGAALEENTEDQYRQRQSRAPEMHEPLDTKDLEEIFAAYGEAAAAASLEEEQDLSDMPECTTEFDEEGVLTAEIVLHEDAAVYQEANENNLADKNCLSYLDLRSAVSGEKDSGQKTGHTQIPQGKSLEELAAAIGNPPSVAERSRQARRAREFDKLSAIFHKQDPESSSSKLPIVRPKTD